MGYKEAGESVLMPAKPMKFTVWEKFAPIQRKFFRIFCRCYKHSTFNGLYSHKQHTYLKAYDLYRD